MINNNKNFSQKFLELAKTRSPFCLGIDPTEELFKSWGLNFDIAGLKKMCEIIIAAAKDNLALVKLVLIALFFLNNSEILPNKNLS